MQTQAWYRRACCHEALQKHAAACSDADMAGKLSRSAIAALLSYTRTCIDVVFRGN